MFFFRLKVVISLLSEFNSSPTDELGSRCHQRLVGAPRKYRAQQAGSMAILWAGTSPEGGHQPAPSQWRKFSGETYLGPVSRKCRTLLGVRKAIRKTPTPLFCKAGLAWSSRWCGLFSVNNEKWRKLDSFIYHQNVDSLHRAIYTS